MDEKLIDKKFVLSIIPKRVEDSHKGTFGRILNIAGSSSYPGAAYLSSVSPLKSGAGFVTLACPNEVFPIVASMAPEVTYKGLLSYEGAISSSAKIDDIESYDVISLGCGLTASDNVSGFILPLIDKYSAEKKMIIDADGLNIIAASSKKISLNGAVITPHPKELSRLINVEVSQILQNRIKYARIASGAFNCITVLKGHNTIVTDGDIVYINTTGNSALAKAGSGDVLTGMISGFASQGISLMHAALCGVYLHGLAGELASFDMTEYSVLASDTIDYISAAISDLFDEE